MKPKINDTEFGSITIDNAVITHDVIITMNGKTLRWSRRIFKQTKMHGQRIIHKRCNEKMEWV